MLDLRCMGGRTGHAHEMALEWVSRANVIPFVEPDPFAGVLRPGFGGKRSKIGQNSNLDFNFLIYVLPSKPAGIPVPVLRRFLLGRRAPPAAAPRGGREGTSRLREASVEVNPGSLPVWYFYVTQQCFWARNLVSGPDFGRNLIGKASKSALRPTCGWPESRFCYYPD